MKVFQNSENKGVGETRNRGFELSKGDYIALLDSDDIWYPNKLETQVRLILKTKAALACTSYALVDTVSNKRLGVNWVTDVITYEEMLSNNLIGCSTVLLSRKIIEKYRFSNEYFHEDYALWLKLLRDGFTAVGIPEIMVDHRAYWSSKSGNKIKSAWHRWNLYRNLLHLSLGQCILNSARYLKNGIKKYRG